MSANAERLELLGFGFVREIYDHYIPDGICLIIIDFSKIVLDSKILTQEEQEYLVQLIEEQPQTKQFTYCKWNLLCRGTRDGIKQKVFHNNCDGEKNTICILDVHETGYVCGGYASTEWKSTSTNTRGQDENTFLFVIRPIEARNVFHRARDQDGK
eukprot:128554_1